VFILAFAVRSAGSAYSGKVNTTISGRTCQRWDSDDPHPHGYHNLADQKNYCRDPNDSGAPWCHTTDPNQPTEFCLISATQGK